MLYQLKEVKLSFVDRFKQLDLDTDVKIEFDSAKRLREFINENDQIFRVGQSIFKVIKFKKIKHYSIEAIIHKITIREYNLEILLS